MVVGYLVSKGALKNLNKYLLMLGAVLSFAVSVGIQMFLFSQKPDVILRYEFVGFFCLKYSEDTRIVSPESDRLLRASQKYRSAFILYI